MGRKKWVYTLKSKVLRDRRVVSWWVFCWPGSSIWRFLSHDNCWTVDLSQSFELALAPGKKVTGPMKSLSACPRSIHGDVHSPNWGGSNAPASETTLLHTASPGKRKLWKDICFRLFKIGTLKTHIEIPHSPFVTFIWHCTDLFWQPI